MPGFDRTGPWGMGPRTGWGRGFCGSRTTGNPAGFGGFGRGRRLGPGWSGSCVRPRFWKRGFPSFYQPTPDEEASWLKEEASSLKEMLGSIERRLSELGKKNSE